MLRMPVTRAVMAATGATVRATPLRLSRRCISAALLAASVTPSSSAGAVGALSNASPLLKVPFLSMKNVTPISGAASLRFTRGASFSLATAPLTSTLAQGRRFNHTQGQNPTASGEQAKEQAEQQQKKNESTAEKSEAGKEEEPKAEGEGDGKGEGEGKGSKGTGKKKSAPKKSFMDHIRGLRADYTKFPDIYNSANAINFIVFTVFCLCSTGSNSEESWWMTQWGLDNTFRPWTWALHSVLTNNFLSMTYAMMLLHTMCHHILPTLGSRGLLLYCGSAAVISGAIMWAGNALYYGLNGVAPEKQFGPWDMVAALFVMEYFYYGLTPFTILNSFSGWIKYAVWVGEVCILYFDWQPTLVGTAVGLALCKGVPRFKAVKMAGTKV